MSDKKVTIIEKIASLLTEDVLYTMGDLKRIMLLNYKDTNVSSIITAVNREVDKKNGLLSIADTSTTEKYYEINKSNISNDMKLDDDVADLKKMASIIYNIVKKQNLRELDHWLNDTLVKVIDDIITEKVTNEIKNEVIPVIKQLAINTGSEMSKDDFRDMMIDVLLDSEI